jgi:preprotein translocase subunit YajC
MKLHALVLQDKPAEGSGGPAYLQFLPIVIIFVLFYFILIRPQRRQQKEREALLGQIKKDDHVVTSGGLFGIVHKANEKDVILKIDEKNDVRVRVLRTAIVDIVKVSGAANEEAKAEPKEAEKK